MQTRLIDGVQIGRRLREQLRDRVGKLPTTPGLAVILLGDDPASQVYVRNKVKACAEVGVRSSLIELPASTDEATLLARIAALNADATIDGLLVQLPLPKHIDPRKVLEAIDPGKDVDGFHLANVGALVTGQPVFAPCTPAGIMEMLAAEGVNPWGKHAVMVGASNIVGKPMAMLLLQKGATVTICNSKTPDLGAMTRQADILVVAIGKPLLVTGDMVKPGAVVIDVGINRLPNGKLAGDVDFAGLQGIASMITPVPGGVGPMTITMLLANTVLAAERK
jgi:methylenetetrahydrofolate dehydrogenase (NADP+) / methenyltetrahydrofolate cyclohydrolase